MNIKSLFFMAIFFAVLNIHLHADEQKQESKQAEKPKPSQLAHIRISGGLEEGVAASDPLFSSIQETLKSKIDRIKKAAIDSEIKGLVLEVDGVGIGWGKVDELNQAVQLFRKSGKKVYAYLEGGELKDYLVAIAADKVFLPESGWLMLTGLRAEVTFYKALMDKIGAQADFLKMGDFKSAVEPYTRTSMSESSRKQLETVLDDFFHQSIIQRIVTLRAGRKFSSEQVRTFIDQGPYTAKRAMELGLIDQVVYFHGVTQEFKKDLKVEEVALVKNYGKDKVEEIDLSNPFAVFKLLATPKTSTNSRPKIAVIFASGAITTGRSMQDFMGDSNCGSTTIIQAIRQAENDKSVKAIVLRVDSPGGSALASDLIWAELKRCKKPVVASMSDVAASGGYYICMAASRIFAEPGTLTGSIGVFGGKINLGGTYGKLGIHSEVITRGANANLFSSTSGFSNSERESMTKLIEDVYDQFLNKAIEGRNKAGNKMDRTKLESLAGGRVWTGRQAKENGLVDELGTLSDAIRFAAKNSGLPADKEPELLMLPKSRGFLDSLFEPKAQMGAIQVAEFLKAIPFAKELRGVGTLLQMKSEPVWLLMPYRLMIQ